MPEIRRVAVLGSSITMIVRPHGEGTPFPRALERLLNEDADAVWLVESRSGIGAIVTDARRELAALVANPPDAIVIEYGHVEGVRRRQPRWVWQGAFMYRPGSPRWTAPLKWLGRRYADLRRRLGWWTTWLRLERFRRS